jgi:hypothetical protein
VRARSTLRNFGTEKRIEKVVVLRELQRAIIYTRELSKQAREGHVSTAAMVYSVNEGARLTRKMGMYARVGTAGRERALLAKSRDTKVRYVKSISCVQRNS